MVIEKYSLWTPLIKEIKDNANESKKGFAKKIFSDVIKKRKETRVPEASVLARWPFILDWLSLIFIFFPL